MTTAIDDLQRLVDGMAATVEKGGTIAKTEVIELQRRVAALKDGKSEEPPKKK